MLRVSLQLPIRLAVIQVDGVRATGNDAGFDALQACSARYREEYVPRGITSPGGVEGVEVARKLFHALGIDPTKHRPCSEALLNRALKNKPQPRVGTLVDVGNWCALDFLLPLGIYDCGEIVGAVTLRKGFESETYRAINGRDIHLHQRYVLADEEGAFGSPITDSVRTAVSDATRRTAIVVYAPRDYAEARFADQMQKLAERVVEHCGGTVAQNELLAGR